MIKPMPTPTSRFYTARDGLKLHMRDWGAPSPLLPVVCLPGLSRNAGDFDVLAARLATSRRVVALDYRGRGLSDRDPDWKHYDLFVENIDILTVLETAVIEAAIFVGTSRGGLHAMLLTGTRPTLLRGVVLNDIGPVLEVEGLRRIQSYVGKLPTPTSWAGAVEIARGIMGAHFTALSEADWEAYARLTFEETATGFVTRYDPAIMKAFAQMDLDKPIPALWPQFEALAPVPVLAIRGENSDLLSPATLDEMARRHPHFDSLTVPGEGHAPLLMDAPTIARIEAFIARIDAA
jgi:pimeloyl-ACP methyl ester carboxylesterase